MRWSLFVLGMALFLGAGSAQAAAKKAAKKADPAKPAEAQKADAKPAEVKPAPAKPEAAKPTFSPEAIEHFEKHVRPVLIAQCQKCHDAKEAEAGLRLDSREAALAGGDGGAVIVLGEPDRSRFIKAIRYDGDLQMPPDAKLPPEAVEALTAWVKAGAPWPTEQPGGAAVQSGITPAFIAQARAEHWAFRPVQNPPEPAVKDTKWPSTGVDRFVLAKLEAAGMAPAPRADRRTLLRRASFDLIGLPPSFEEIAAFENDPSPDAWSRAIDRLLASPHYGERWGRYWLDIARYADTKGYVFQEERRYPFSYTYRDYVIRSLNEDLPYDRFLVEQLAADRLDLGEDKRPLAAMGFLTLGRRFLNNTHDIIDDRIDVVMRGTQGLTVACARCHDHKFDPIPTKDYYSLYGIFASSNEPKDPPQIAVPEKTPQFEAYLKELGKREGALNAFLEKQRAEQLAKNPKQDVAGDKIEKLLDRPAKNTVRDLRKKIEQWRATSPSAPQHAMVLNDNAQPHQPKVFKRGNPGTQGDAVPRQYLEVLAGPERKPFTDGSGRLELAKAIANRDNPLTARVMVNRVWLYHFGKPLVDTPSDFGKRSEVPTHPELLDWLASKFMEEGWSLKKLHKQMMLSSAYQQSSQARPEYVTRDPENRLLSHYNRRRLDFEATRDSLLAASGRLDETLFGKSVELSTQPFTNRRTLYGFIDRQNIDPLFRTFDFASPDSTSPQRYATTVPQQALFMLNSPFVIEQARSLLARPEVAEASQPPQKIAALYQLAYGRQPTADEVALGMAFVGGTPGPAQPLVVAPKVWQYGYGEFDDAAGKLKAFKALPHFTGQAWQGSAKLPDDKLGWVLLTPAGGHPGNATHAVVRRWIAPRDGVVSISGKLNHPEQNGDGVRARVSSNRKGKVGEWAAHKSEASTEVPSLEVKQGDTLDFVVDCKGAPDHDSFAWAPVVRIVEAGGTGAGAVAASAGPNEWSAESGFSGPDGTPPAAPLGPWDRYAQVLLLANELVFID